jgi:hypothetical protein
MKNSLAIYLQDHLAGAVHAITLAEMIRDQHSGTPLGTFAAGLLDEIKSDRDVLNGIAKKVGTNESATKDLTAWFGEKLSQVKLTFGNTAELGTLEELELLELGIHGKWGMWRALANVSGSDPRLQDIDFDALLARAQAQASSVEKRRLEAAQNALCPAVDEVQHH